MKIYNVTFQVDVEILSLAICAYSIPDAKRQAKLHNSIYLPKSKKANNYQANVVVHGVDGFGKSLNKLKRK